MPPRIPTAALTAAAPTAITEVVEASQSAQPRQVALGSVDGAHLDLLARALMRILRTELAEVTYAQIIDGLPTGDVAYEAYSIPYAGHPINDAHDELCPGMLDKAREFRDGFRPELLSFDAQLLRDYRSCSPGSRGFKMRLLELVVAAVHEIAAVLFELDSSVHKDDSVTDWAPPESETLYWRWHPNGPHPTLFFHEWYVNHDKYPRGVADMVGYWAEARILGGVVLFDRRNPNADTPDAFPPVDPDAVYFHSDREHVTYRIYQILPDQRRALLDFLLDNDPPESPLPILGDRNNTVRVDPEEPIRSTGIYRDLWERKDLPPRCERPEASRCVGQGRVSHYGGLGEVAEAGVCPEGEDRIWRRLEKWGLEKKSSLSGRPEFWPHNQGG